MDHIVKRDGDFAADLESGRAPSEENGIMRGDEVVLEVKVVVDKKLKGGEALDLEEKRVVKEKRKKSSNKKALKPPRPPRGPSLDAADQKLIREISEQAMLKRARIERIKASKKTKAVKASSSNSNLLAMVFTILFCLVILFQGMCSRSSMPVKFQGSPESAATAEGNLISFQYYQTISTKYSNGPDSVSPSFIERLSGLDPPEKVIRVPV